MYPKIPPARLPFPWNPRSGRRRPLADLCFRQPLPRAAASLPLPIFINNPAPPLSNPAGAARFLSFSLKSPPSARSRFQRRLPPFASSTAGARSPFLSLSPSNDLGSRAPPSEPSTPFFLSLSVSASAATGSAPSASSTAGAVSPVPREAAAPRRLLFSHRGRALRFLSNRSR